MPKGLFVTFEGINGSGKTTQLRRLAAWLKSRGVDVLVTRQAGGTTTGGHDRSLHLNAKTTGIPSRQDLDLIFSGRAEALEKVILPALEDRRVVLCDRYTDSTEAYQGGGHELGSEMILQLHRTLCHDVWPDLTILLLTDYSASLERAKRRQASFGGDERHFEREKDAFYQRVYEKYIEIATRETQRVLPITGNDSATDIHTEILKAVIPLLAFR